MTLKSRDWVEAVRYIGPDRRRFNSGDYAGPRKRKSDATITDSARVEQALRIMRAALHAIDTDPHQAMRSMLAQAAVRHVFAPGEMVIRAGEPGSSMFVVHNGRVSVQISENGRPRNIATLNEGDFFGEMALFTGEPRTANVVAVEETEVLEIGHAAMKRVFDTNPDLVESLSFIMAERRQGLASQADSDTTSPHSTAGILSSIKRFFGL